MDSLIPRRAFYAALALLASAAAIAGASGVARAGDAAPPGDERPARAQPGGPLCWVELVDRLGLPEECYLLGFEGGVYRIRTVEGQEIDVPEAELRSIRFFPLSEAPGFGKGPGREPADQPPRGRPHRTDEAEERPRIGAALWELQARREEAHRKLLELKQKGKLDAYIADLESRLRKADSAQAAIELLMKVIPAYRAAGRFVGIPELEGLVRSIEDPAVRAAITMPEALRRLRNQLLPAGPLRRGARPD